MKIKKVDDKSMVIHMKEKEKLHTHTHEPKKDSIEAANIYTVDHSSKMNASSNDIANNKKFRRSTIHSVDKVPKGMFKQYQAALKKSKQPIKMKNSYIKVVGVAGVQTALSHMEGGEEVMDAANSRKLYDMIWSFMEGGGIIISSFEKGVSLNQEGRKIEI